MDVYDNYSREDLVAKIKALEQHNIQLKNIIAKQDGQKVKKDRNRQKAFNFERCKFRHVLLKFFYLGWDYQGYVIQEDTANTVEHHIFEALQKTCLIENRSNSNYNRCGRTDKGVSSFSQVISLKVRSVSDSIENELDYCNLLNRILPNNIQFYAWTPVEDGFSARFDCKNRTYKYFFPKGTLDINAIRKGSEYLIGNHDFRNFCKMDVNNGVVEFQRTIYFVNIDVMDSTKEEYATCVLTIKGNAFLWHQIRYIVSILLLIGQKKEEPELILNLLDVLHNPRKPDYQLASEIPLNLFDCEYEGVEWIYSNEGVNAAVKKLQQFWTSSNMKVAMVKTMLTQLQAHASLENNCLSDFLIQGVKPKNYVPVMKRKLCDSLEEKIGNIKIKRNKKEN